MIDQVPPHNLQAEVAMLGVLLLSRDARDNGLQLLSAGDFYQPSYRFIFEAILELHERGEAVDVVTVAEQLRGEDVLEFCGGPSTLSHIQNSAPGYNYARYAEIIVSHSSMRQVIHLCNSIAIEAYELPDDVGELIDRLRAEAKHIDTPLGSVPSGLWTVEDFMGRPKEERPQWLIRGLIREMWRIVVVAVEGFGKTVLLHQIALSGARGVHPFVPYVHYEPITTLMVDCENPTDRLDDGFEYITPRLDGLAAAVPGKAYLWSQPGGINLRTRSDRSALEAVVEYVRPQLVCAGPVYKTFLAKAGEPYELVARDVQAVWDRLRTRYNFALVLEAHASKGAGGVRSMDPEGSALWLRWSEFGLKMLRNAELNGINEDKYYDVKRFRLDRIRQHGWPAGLERSVNGLPWAARWENAHWKEYILETESDVEPEAIPPEAYADDEDNGPF